MSVGKGGDREGFLAYSKKIQEISRLEKENEKTAQYVRELDSKCTLVALKLGEATLQSSLLHNLRPETVHAQNHVEATV